MHIQELLNIKTIFKTRETCKSLSMRTRPDKELQHMTHCICSIPCECGINYVEKTDRALPVQLCQHKHNLRKALSKKSGPSIPMRRVTG